MNEIYACIASGLREAGLPASTFIVEQYLGRNDFKGLVDLLLKSQETCSLSRIINMSCKAAL